MLPMTNCVAWASAITSVESILKTSSHISLTQMDWMNIRWIRVTRVFFLSGFSESLLDRRKRCAANRSPTPRGRRRRERGHVRRGTETFLKSANVWHEKKREEMARNRKRDLGLQISNTFWCIGGRGGRSRLPAAESEFLFSKVSILLSSALAKTMKTHHHILKHDIQCHVTGEWRNCVHVELFHDISVLFIFPAKVVFRLAGWANFKSPKCGEWVPCQSRLAGLQFRDNRMQPDEQWTEHDQKPTNRRNTAHAVLWQEDRLALFHQSVPSTCTVLRFELVWPPLEISWSQG